MVKNTNNNKNNPFKASTQPAAQKSYKSRINQPCLCELDRVLCPSPHSFHQLLDVAVVVGGGIRVNSADNKPIPTSRFAKSSRNRRAALSTSRKLNYRPYLRLTLSFLSIPGGTRRTQTTVCTRNKA